jgi:hypothetical protein
VIRTRLRRAEELDGMAGSRAMYRENLRELRRPLLAELDVIARDALADGRTQAFQAAILRRDALRKITEDSRIDAAKTVDDLLAIEFREFRD